ncbi:hypothetical protein SH139x_001036 [Planctomycetaceae bacterium SH139]
MSNQIEQNVRPLPFEPDAHVVSRRFRTGVRIMLALSLIVTIVCIFFFREAAYLAAIPIPVLYAVLAFSNYLEVRSRASSLRSPNQKRITIEELEMDIETVGIVTLMKVIGVLAIGTFIIAASFFNWPMVGVVAATLLCIAILIQTPFLPLYFSESERDELAKLKHERNHSRR